MSLITSVTTSVYSKICYNFIIFSTKKKIILKNKKNKFFLYKMLVEYYLNDNINASFEGFALVLQNVWVSLAAHSSKCQS